MKTIWKFPITLGETKVSMPEHAYILSIQYQGQELCLWAIVDTKAPETIRTFEVYETGHEIDINKVGWLATVQRPPFVWHVFERP